MKYSFRIYFILLWFLVSCAVVTPEAAPTLTATPTLTSTSTPIPLPTATPTSVAAGEINMAPLPDDGDSSSNEEALQIPEVVITKDMTVKAILDAARGEFEKNPWKGNLWAKDLHTFGQPPAEPVYLYFDMVDKEGKPGKAGKATEVPVEFLAFIGSQENLRLQKMDRAFFPVMLPQLEEKWGVLLDDILFMPSVIHLQGRDLYVLEFTDAGLALGTYGGVSTYSDMQEGAGPRRTLTQTVNFSLANGETEDPYNANLPHYLGAEPWKFTDEKGKEQVMQLSEAWAYVGNLINSPLQSGESEGERLDKIQGLFDQIPFSTSRVTNVSK